MFWDACATLPKVDDGLDKAEKATVEGAMQPNQREKDVNFILLDLCIINYIILS
jgi:hypothetical protein